MSTNKASFATIASLTITLNSLANNAARESTEVDNSSLAFLDVQLEIDITLALAATGDKAVNVYLARSLDGVKWPDVVTGANAAITIGDARNLQLLGTLYCPSGTGPFRGIFDTAAGPNAALALTPWWTIAVENKTGQAFAAASCVARYGGLHIISV